VREPGAALLGPKGPLAGFCLGTVGPDGCSQAAGIGAVRYDDGDLYFTRGPGTLKARNLASNPACTIAVRFPGLDLTLEGAAKVSDPAILERVASIYRDIGWPAGRPAKRSPPPTARRAPGRRPGSCTG
jgi:Pyridoxamine 5'-phosphate oxidase